MLLEPLHEEYYTEDDDLVVFRCQECGFTSMSLGYVHGHIEGHRGYTRFNIQLPLTDTSPGNYEALMDRTEVVRVAETESITLSEVEGL
jgi:hypothetical protein